MARVTQIIGSYHDTISTYYNGTSIKGIHVNASQPVLFTVTLRAGPSVNIYRGTGNGVFFLDYVIQSVAGGEATITFAAKEILIQSEASNVYFDYDIIVQGTQQTQLSATRGYQTVWVT
jgi:hypothetical protein